MKLTNCTVGTKHLNNFNYLSHDIELIDKHSNMIYCTNLYKLVSGQSLIHH